MQIKRLAMYEFNKPKIACNKCRDNKTNVQFNVIGRLEKLIQSEFKGNIPQSRSSTNFFAHTRTTEQTKKITNICKRKENITYLVISIHAVY